MYSEPDKKKEKMRRAVEDGMRRRYRRCGGIIEVGGGEDRRGFALPPERRG